MGFCGVRQEAVSDNFKDHTNHNICPVIYNATFEDDIVARDPFGSCSRVPKNNAKTYIKMIMGFKQTQVQLYVDIAFNRLISLLVYVGISWTLFILVSVSVKRIMGSNIFHYSMESEQRKDSKE